VLVILDKTDKNVYLSSRNLQQTKVISANAINTYDILNANNILVVESSIKEIEKIHSVN
jgi:large subunit ribosomal protein L4